MTKSPSQIKPETVQDATLSPEVVLPRQIVTRRSAVFGMSGSGKSNTATVIIEQLLTAGEQVVLIDPKGEGYGLQTSANGKKAGFDIIVFGPPRGDIPDLRVEHAEQIADFVVDSGRSVALSLLGFGSDQDERKFVTSFFKRLYRRKSQMPVKTRTLVVLEEAHLFVPEQASGGVSEMVGAIKRIARQGRSAGLGLMIVDQRPQDVAKSVISQSELLICHQLTHKLDRAALQDWVKAYDSQGQGETFMASLAELKPGEAWVWSPAWLNLFKRTHINRRTTFDSGATPDGVDAVAPTARASVNLQVLQAHLNRIAEEARANDPAALKKENADLRRQLAVKGKSPPPVTPVEKIVEKIVEKEVPVITDEQLRQGEAFFKMAASKMTELLSAFDGYKKHNTVLPAKLVTAAVAVRRGAPEPARVVLSASPGELSKGEQAMLTACAQNPDGVSRNTLTGLTGYKRSTRDTYIYRLAGKHLVVQQGDDIVITLEGVAALGDSFTPLPVGSALLAHWLEKLPEGEKTILALLVNRGNFVNRDEITNSTGYKRSTRDTYLYRLQIKRLVETGKQSDVKAADILFD